MDRTAEFIDTIKRGYSFQKDFITLGAAMMDGKPLEEALVHIPLSTLNRHGLIAGATGTGKTKTLQVLTEQFSQHGIPVLLMDIKGDLSGLAQPGKLSEPVRQRQELTGLAYEPRALPVELLSVSEEKGAHLRATVSEFGPVLFSRILDLNDTQSGIVSLVFKYADDNDLPLLDLKDFKKLLQYATAEGKEEIEKAYGRISGTSVSTILRKLIELEQQGAEILFGERSFDTEDLLRKDTEGHGIVSILRLTDIQDRPKLFSTFMLCLLAEIYSTFPEEGDLDKPKLILFIDEAHLIFDEASDALRDQLEAIIKLIRSKGVGIFFCTQDPGDVPDAVLSQLGLKIQHALRAFTARDRKMIKKTAENYPVSEFYETDKVLTSMGIGEALVTVLNEKGRPTPLVVTYLRAPVSRMDILSAAEIDELVSKSALVPKYNETVDRASAYEILQEKIRRAREDQHREEVNNQQEKARKALGREETFFESLSKNTMARQLGRTVVREVTRAFLGVLGVRSTRRRR